MTSTSTQGLRRILGLGFGLAMAFGGTVGVGILRLPGSLAQQLGDARLIILFWVFGAGFALLGAVAVAELAAMTPLAGGFYVYARRAFGPGAGFVVGIADWLNNVCALAYAALTAGAFIAELWPASAANPRALAVGLIMLFTALHSVGLRMSGALVRLISFSVGFMMIAVVVGCFVGVPSASGAAVHASMLVPGGIAAALAALRSVFVAFDGWYSSIYTAEESTSPATTLPRAIIGGTIVIAAIYVLYNLAILRVLPIDQLAASTLPAADAARLVLPSGGGPLVTVICIFTVLSLINAMMVILPRIILAMARDGLMLKQAAQVSRSGVPRTALLGSSLAAALLIFSGSFEEIVAMAAVLFLMDYVSAYTALIVLRRREPAVARPYRAFGFPYSTLIVLAGCFALWIALIADNPRAAKFAALLVAACVPMYWWLRSRRSPSTTAGDNL